MTSPISLFTNGVYQAPCPPPQINVVIQASIKGIITSAPAPIKGIITASPTPIKGRIVEDCEAPPFDITALGLVPPSQVELGTIVASPAFTSAQNRPPTSLVLTNDANAESKSVVATPLAFNSDQSYSASVPNTLDTFTLTGDDGGAPDAEVVTMQHVARHWFGFSTLATLLTDADVLALEQLQTALSTDITFDHTFAAVTNRYFHHVWHDFFLPLDPLKYFTDGLFNSGVIDVGAVAMTSVPLAFTARDIRTGLLATSGSPIRFERRL